MIRAIFVVRRVCGIRGQPGGKGGGPNAECGKIDTCDIMIVVWVMRTLSREWGYDTRSGLMHLERCVARCEVCERCL